MKPGHLRHLDVELYELDDLSQEVISSLNLALRRRYADLRGISHFSMSLSLLRSILTLELDTRRAVPLLCR